MAGRGAAVATSRTSGSTKACEVRATARNCYTQRNGKPTPVAVTIWSSARSVFRHRASTRSWAMTCLRSLKTIRVITGIIICTNGSGKGRQVVSFVAYVAQYYAERLHFYERLDLTRCAEASVLDIAGEASALHKFLIDILEEGYTTTVNRLVEQTDAFNRLQGFLSTVLAHLGGPSARERFYLCPDLIPLPQLTTETFAGGAIFELQAYLDHLEHLLDAPVDIAPCFDSASQMQRWQAKTQVLMTEMVAFLHWLCARLAQPVPVVPVPLLRDTLLIHLGLTWLRHHGMPIP